MANDPGAYVVRATDAAPDGRVVYTVVDMNGRVSKVTIPRHLTLTELADPIIRTHIAHQPSTERVIR